MLLRHLKDSGVEEFGIDIDRLWEGVGRVWYIFPHKYGREWMEMDGVVLG